MYRQVILSSLILFTGIVLVPASVMAQQRNTDPSSGQKSSSASMVQSFDLKPNDTLSYLLKSVKESWVSVRSTDANLAIALELNGQKVMEQDFSRGIHSAEIFKFKPHSRQKYVLKVWAKSYVSEKKNVELEIAESNKPFIPQTQFSGQDYLDDLAAFRMIREKANSGLYVYRSKAQIDSLYSIAQDEARNCKSIFDFYKIIVKLTDYEGSCHNYTNLPNQFAAYYPDQKIYLPLTLKNVSGQLLQNSKGLSIPLSAEILSINGISSAEIIERLSGYYHSDGFARPYKDVAGFEKGMLDKFIMEFGPRDKYRITYMWKGQESHAELPAISYEQAKALQESRHSLIYDRKLQGKKYALDQVDSGIYRLSIRGFDFAADKNDKAYLEYEKFLDEMIVVLAKKNIRHLILDLRGNTGGAGALYEKTYSYLSDRPFRDAQFAYTNFNEVPFGERMVLSPFLLDNKVTQAADVNTYLKVEYPTGVQGKYYWSNERNVLVLPNEKTYKGQLYLLIDEYVASAGSHLASLVKSYTNAWVIGKETNGGYYEHNGHIPFEYQLPKSGIQTGFSIVYVNQDAQKLDDQPFGSGIVPHLKVEETAEDFMMHRDVYLDIVKKLAQP